MSLGYKTRYGHKIQTLPVSIASDCPNRRGLKGMKACIFCDEWGSAAYPELQPLSLEEQIRRNIEVLGPKFSAQEFLVYFQAYTSTFLDFQKLRNHVETALSIPRVHGFILGTRPDTLSQATLNLLKEKAQSHYVSVELGVQSFSDEHLKWLERGHNAQVAIKAVEKLKGVPNLEVGIHLMFGLPSETDTHIQETARLVSTLPIDHVKLHNLHVLKNTPLEELYRRGEFQPVELDEYARRVILFLQHLDPRIRIQRLGAVASRWGELVAPRWTTYKMRTYQFIIDRMNEQKAFQGEHFTPLG